ncbi:MAG: hypothetical protein K6B38_14190, partial [Ruminococcus sp.]|nr:hypothetical protein [Ruminococcus sp.]
HRVNVRIIRHNFVGDKAKIRRRAVALQGFLTQSPAKFDEKTCMNPYVYRFLICLMAGQQLLIPEFGKTAVSAQKDTAVFLVTDRNMKSNMI